MAANRGPMAGTTILPPSSSSSIARLAPNSVYHDRPHLQYYAGTVKPYCGKKTKLEKQVQKDLSALHDGSFSEKRRMKLMELVSKDLAALSNSFSEGMDGDKSLAEQVRGQIFSDAVQVVMTQLEQVKAERKLRKKEMKAQKAATKAQKKLKNKGKDDSSSSSESSYRECELVDAAQLRMTPPAMDTINRIPEPPKMAGDDEGVAPDAIPAILVENPPNITDLHREFTEGRLACRQVQVCMGGKCKKLGSEQLLAAFEGSIQKYGMASAVEAVACKCMGKCKNAPNVRVQNDFCKELHMGVGIGDVDLVLDRHFGLKLTPI